MNNVGVIDTFLNTFTTYIDSGFGLIKGEVGYLSSTLIVIDITLAGLFWAWGADEDPLHRLLRLHHQQLQQSIGHRLQQLRRPRPEGGRLVDLHRRLPAAGQARPGRARRRSAASRRGEPDDGLHQLLRELRPDRGADGLVDPGADRLLHPGGAALRDAHRVQADDARGLHPHSVRPLQQDRLPRREGARQYRRLWRQGDGAGGHRRHRHRPLLAVHPDLRRRPADRRASAICRAGRTRHAGPRYLRPWHRNRTRLRRAAARCGGRRWDRPRGRRHGDGRRWRAGPRR